MILTSEQIESITSGAERLTVEENGLRFWRFTPAQQEMYQLRSGLGMHNMTAGVRLCMRTDSTTLTLRVLVLAYYVNFASFSFDIHVNGKPVGHLDCFIPEQITGVHEKVFDLGTGLKTVDIYFPFSVHVLLQQLALDDGAFWQPVI